MYRIETYPRLPTRPRERLVTYLVGSVTRAHVMITENRRLPWQPCAKSCLVDDDDDLREALSEQLVMTEDFDVFEGRTGAEGMEKAKAGHYDLVILDVGLPDTDGRELCRRMRKQGVKSPILMLTGHDTEATPSLGLDAAPMIT